MTTPSYAELVAAVRQEGEGIVATAGMGQDVAVRTCGDWMLPDLFRHVGQVYAYVGRLLTERVMTDPGGKPPVPDGVDPVGYVADTLEELVDALASSEPDAPVWNWSDRPDVAAFWARRMAHESAVHRYDAQRAHGLAQPIDADLARDGMDELVDVLLPEVVKRRRPEVVAATYAFEAIDEGRWAVRLGPEGIERLATARDADVRVRGPASSVLLAAYGRVKWASLEVTGDAALLDAWSRSMRV